MLDIKTGEEGVMMNITGGVLVNMLVKLNL